MEKPNIRFQDGQWLDAERLNKAMEAVDAAVDATNAAEASAAGANTSAAQSAQSANTARQDADATAADLAAIKRYVDGNQTVGEQGANIALLQNEVAKHDKAISPYSKSNPLPLTHNLATGSILAMEGDMVVLKAQAGWGITRIDREEFGALGLASGDTLLLPMAHFDQEGKPTDNLMLVGAVLFAAEEAVKGQSGEVLYTRRTSLFRATDNAIATWGGVKKWLAIADNESLLICHPLDITEATITRNGNDAANAAADLNQRRRIEEKLNLGGKDPRAWVGMADQLAPSEKTEQAAYRDEVLPAGRILGFAPELGPSGAGTRDGQIADEVSPVMREVAGVTSGGNQECNYGAYTNSKLGITVTRNGNYISLHGTVTSTPAYGFFNLLTSHRLKRDGRKHLFVINKRGDFSFGINGFGSTRGLAFLWSDNAGGDWECWPNLIVAKDNVLNLDDVCVVCLDLTTLPQLPAPFVASLGDTDAHRVAHALGFLALQRD